MKISSISLALLLACGAMPARSAEDFQVRYNLAGSLGGEMFAPPDKSGLAVGLAATRVSVDKVSGSDGEDIRTTLPGGVVSVSGVDIASYNANESVVKATGTFNLYNLGVGYVSTERFGGGRLGFVLNVPYGRKDQRVRAETSVPSLSPVSPVPQVPQGVSDAFAANYMNQVNATAAAQSGEVDGIGDTEVMAGWLLNTDQWRVLLGSSMVLPTGRYQSTDGPDIGHGNFYTFRPAAQVAWLPRPDVSLAGKVTFGINTRNQDSRVRSGNWVGLEAAIAVMTPLGPVGVHGIHVQQVQDDSRNPIGDARFRSNNVGVFFTTMLPTVDVVMTLQTMRTFDSRYARHGSFQQVRLLKLF